MQDFSIIDYARMWRIRGWRLPFQYFFENHLFDIIHKTNTHARLDKANYVQAGFENNDSGVHYMSSRTSEVVRSLIFIKNNIGENFNNFQFFDLGCGKGKTLMIYSKKFGQNAEFTAIGIDYYQPLVDVAQQNLLVTELEDRVDVYTDDARNFDRYMMSKNVIIYLYNPFGADILTSIIKKCRNLECYVIYTDPVHGRLLEVSGFEVASSHTGIYPNSTTSIFHKTSY